jgi:hypothetical protein
VKSEDRDPFGCRDPLLGATPKLTLQKRRRSLRQGQFVVADPKFAVSRGVCADFRSFFNPR